MTFKILNLKQIHRSGAVRFRRKFSDTKGAPNLIVWGMVCQKISLTKLLSGHHFFLAVSLHIHAHLDSADTIC